MEIGQNLGLDRIVLLHWLLSSVWGRFRSCPSCFSPLEQQKQYHHHEQLKGWHGELPGETPCIRQIPTWHRAGQVAVCLPPSGSKCKGCSLGKEGIDAVFLNAGYPLLLEESLGARWGHRQPGTEQPLDCCSLHCGTTLDAPWFGRCK